MLQPEAETGAGASAGADGARHRDGGAGARLDMAAGGSEELGSGGSGGNRWPRQETLALLQIRSDMDAVFRDSSHKGPLWEQVSRKMAELGYRRSDKKCREKFENVYKYHKRTKEGRAGKGDGKTYRFFDQLQSFLPPIESAVPIAMAMPPPRTPQPPFTVPSTTPPIHQIQAAVPVQNYSKPISFPESSPSGTPSSSSSTSSDEEITGVRRSRRKRKWKDFFVKLTKDVIAKQDELQRKFLEVIERRESDRRVRDEAWKGQELARLQRECEILVHERSMASAKDAALVSFLQKLSDHQQIPLPPAILQSQPNPNPIPLPVVLSISQPQQITPNVDINPVATTPPPKQHNGSADRSAGSGGSSSRWPKEEIEALITLRTRKEEKYQEGGAKGPLWEEISVEMKTIGYNRNAKRCKEKWENINKYFRKVKESNKKPRVDSKTCPYYYQLESLYATKSTAIPPAGEPHDVGDQDEDEDEDEAAGGYEIVGKMR